MVTHKAWEKNLLIKYLCPRDFRRGEMEEKMNIEIYVVTHKKSRMPIESIFVPVQVGKNEDIPDFQRDNTGDNIACKNDNYCELTAQYWAMKNRKADIKGLVHYRRIFTNGKKIPSWMSNEYKYKNLITKEDIIKILDSGYDVILPIAHNYISETAYEHYKHNHDSYDAFELVREYLITKYPLYVDAFDCALNSKKSHLLNMMIAPDNIFNKYSDWLFEVLKYVEDNYPIGHLDDYEKRIFGFISELLLDVWITTNNIKYKEMPVVYLEHENYIKRYTHSIKGKLGLLK